MTGFSNIYFSVNVSIELYMHRRFLSTAEIKLPPVQRYAIIWINVGIFIIEFFGTNVSEIPIKIKDSHE